MATVRIATIDEVNTDEDLKRYFAYMRKLIALLIRELAHAAGDLSAVLKAYDRKAGRRRRGKVVRPLALAAGVLVLVSKYITTAAKRFEVEYQPEIDSRRRGAHRRRDRTFTFGG